MRKVCIANVGRALAVLAVVAMLAGVALAQDPAGKFQAFGQAKLVIGGLPPEDGAADLSKDGLPSIPATGVGFV